MRSKTPVTDADRHQLSKAFLALAEQVEDIWEELAVNGHDIRGAVVRAAQEELAEEVSSKRQLRDYWREMAKEELAALDSPLDIRKGYYVAPYCYRSNLIDELRKAAQLLPELPVQLEPSDRAWQQPWTRDSPKFRTWEVARGIGREAAQRAGEPPCEQFLVADWRERMRLQRERYALRLSNEGFRLASPSRSFTMFERRTTDNKYVFHLIDDSSANLSFGSLSIQFAVTWPGTRISSARLFANRMIAFRPDQIAPNFRYSCSFDRDSWAQFCMAVDDVSFLTTILFRRLDAELQRSLEE